MKIADDLDRHNILDEFEFRQDQTIHLGVTCPCAKKNPYSTLSAAKTV